MAFAIGLFSGCGVTGGTSARKVALNPVLGSATLTRTVSVGSVAARSDAGVNRAIGAYNLGKFDDSDLATLHGTLERSLPTATASRGASRSGHPHLRAFVSRSQRPAHASGPRSDF